MSARKKTGKLSSAKPSPSSLNTPLLEENLSEKLKSNEEASKSIQIFPSDTPSTLIEHLPKSSTNGSRASVLRDAAASDLHELKPTVTFADQMYRSGNPISISDLLSKIPKGMGGIRQLKLGGIEAIPVISGEDVKVHILSICNSHILHRLKLKGCCRRRSARQDFQASPSSSRAPPTQRS